MLHIDRRIYSYWACWFGILVLAWIAYRPGLSGGFLFDDFVNLPALGESGPVDDSRTFWRYITSGTADPTGRPIALLSFLLDARDWPADPAPFLRTNLWIHLINGTLLLVLLRQLGRALEPGDRREAWAALIGAGVWLLHPLFVSTTLYIVQREAMLPVTFILLGLIAFSAGRERLTSTRGQRGAGLLVSGLALGTLFAFLSKANGLLLPLLAGVLEVTVYSGAKYAVVGRRLAWSKRVFILLPTVVVLLYLASFLPQWDVEVREGWTVGQRVLTQARVIFDYLHLLAVPRSVSTGLYNDSYVASQGLLQPLSTLPALLLTISALVFAVQWRRRYPPVAAAILFYAVGHLLESTVVPLELYFEHRNYLPALLLFWPLARWIVRARFALVPKIGSALILLLLLAVTTWQRAQIWGTPERLAALWTVKNPDSSRAQATAAIEEVAAGHPERAMKRLGPLWDKRPGDLQIAFNYVNASCAAGGLSKMDVARLSKALEVGQTGTLLVRQWLEKAIGIAKSGQCPGLDLQVFDQLLLAARSNPAINTPVAREKSMPPLLAMLALERGMPDEALRNFDRALAANIAPETAAGQAALLASRGYYRQALAHLDTYERVKQRAPAPHWGMPWIHQRVLEQQGYWPNELGLLRRNIQHELGSAEDQR